MLLSILSFVAPLLLSTLSLAALHWFPWNNGARPLDRFSAYAVGTAVIVGFPVLVMLLVSRAGMHYDELFWAALLVSNCLVGGATVRLAYWIDERRVITLDEATYAAERN